MKRAWASLVSLLKTSQGRDWLLALGLVALMFLMVWVSAQQDAGDEMLPPLTTHSTASDGAQGLYLWLDALGYEVHRVQDVDFNPRRGDRLLFVLSPDYAFSPGEIERLEDWVVAGGTLVLATTDRWVADPLLAHFDIEMTSDELAEVGEPAQPLLLDPPWSQASVRTERRLVSARDDVVGLMTAGDRPLLVTFDHGAGRVFVAATTYPFTNAGLRDSGNARLVHNLVATVGAGAQVAFDEYHHGYQTPRTLMTWLKVTPQGRSLIYAGVIVFLYLLIGGRRFGRPVPLPETQARRAPIEHIRAMANLFRRGGKRSAVLRHYHDRLKRELAYPHHLDPTLNDDDFVAQLGALRPEINLGAMSKLLYETRQKSVSESELIRLAREVDDWTSKTK